MRVWITIYTEATGEILYSMLARESEEDSCCLAGQAWVEGQHSADDWWVDTSYNPPAVTLRGDIEGVISITGNNIENIPEGTKYILFNEPEEVLPEGDTTLELDVDVSQYVQVTLDHVAYKRVTLNVWCVP